MKKIIDLLFPTCTVWSRCQVIAINKRVPFWKVSKSKKCKFKKYKKMKELSKVK
jgi:hypothetical protein